LVGFTGKLAAKYVVQNCPTDLKWAVAGRSHAKLTAIVDEITQININRRAPGIAIADSGDLEAMTSIAKSTKVVLSFAGPFATFFLPLKSLTLDMGVNSYRLVRKTGPIMLISLERLPGRGPHVAY
jgi:short subunit dehydrogenase-like uncharacterized protein